MSEEQSLEQLQEELIKEKEKAAELLAGWQRAKADYLNLKKDEEKKAKETFEWANAAFMSEILPVYSHFKLALQHIPEDQKKLPWVEGVIFIQKTFQDFLKKYQIKEIKTVGEKFDPNLHEALTHEEKDGYEADVIFEEVAPGYLLDGKVLLPAKVKVAK
ncbi:MAG: nucleotide exchange factor GrpE [Candidatus Buchananbacteria bacterium]